MTYVDLCKKLVNCGCNFEREGRGSHEVWRSRVTGKRTTVPRRSGKDLPPGTVRTIVRDLGIDKSDFDKA